MRSTCLALATLLLCSCTPDLRNVNWSTYLGDPGRSHYSELVQINRDNVHELDVAWVYDSGELVPGSRPIMYTSPLVIDGVLYGLSPRLVAFALDAATGEEVWRHDPDAGGPAQRGLMWWQDDGGIIRLHEIPVGFNNRYAYVEHCASCHGIDREGTDAGPSLVDIGARLTRGQLARVLREARGRMPSFDHLQDFERTPKRKGWDSARRTTADPTGHVLAASGL